MANLTAADSTVELLVPNKGEVIDLAISGTYVAQTDLERENGSVGSNSWEFVKTVTTGVDNATVADTYTSRNNNENLRLRNKAYTSGTVVATLTDNDDRTVAVFQLFGSTGLTVTEADVAVPGTLTVTGNHTTTGGKIGPVPVIITGATTLTAALHAGRVVSVTGTGAGYAITMPTPAATGNVYTLFYAEIAGSGNHTVVTAGASEEFSGGVGISSDIAGVTFLSADNDDTITMNRTTSGGAVAGSWLRFTDINSTDWMMEGFLLSSGSESDPFTAGV